MSDCLHTEGKTTVGVVNLIQQSLFNENDLPYSTPEELENNISELLRIDKAEIRAHDKILETDINIKLADYVLSNAKRDETGRLEMPLMWNPSIKHRLSQNLNLSKSILLSSKKKLL